MAISISAWNILATPRPSGFCAVQGQVGAFHQPLGLLSVLRRAGDTDADTDNNLMSFDVERRFQQPGQPVGKPDGVGRQRQRDLQDGELVPAEPPDGVGFAQAMAQPPGNRLQQQVARGVPERVIDMLEPVEIEKVQRDQATPARPQDGLFELVTKKRAVGQVGQHVIAGKVFEPRFGGTAFVMSS